MAQAANNNLTVVSFIRIKAIERQFHTFFDWKQRNANTFFAAFGDAFATNCRKEIREDQALANAISAFMEIGETRNKLARLNFAGFPVDKTSAEIYTLYQTALPFS